VEKIFHSLLLLLFATKIFLKRTVLKKLSSVCRIPHKLNFAIHTRKKTKILKEFPLYLNKVTSVIIEEISGWGNKNYREQFFY